MFGGGGATSGVKVRVIVFGGFKGHIMLFQFSWGRKVQIGGAMWASNCRVLRGVTGHCKISCLIICLRTPSGCVHAFGGVVSDGGRRGEKKTAGGRVLVSMATGRWEGPLELSMELLQAEGKVLDLCRSLALPRQPGGQGEVQVGGETSQVSQGVGHEQLPGVPTQQKLHEIVLLTVHVHQEVRPAQGVKGEGSKVKTEAHTKMRPTKFKGH